MLWDKSMQLACECNMHVAEGPLALMGNLAQPRQTASCMWLRGPLAVTQVVAAGNLA